MTIQRCRACGRHQHYPRLLCTACHATDLETVEASGLGSLWSFTVIHRSPRPDMAAPYTVALVRLDEGPVVLTHLVDTPEPRCDMPVAEVAGSDPPVFRGR